MKNAIATWACALALCLSTSFAWAQEDCTTSNDCPDNHFCAISGSADCVSGADCEPMEEGRCEPVPEGIIQCAAQEDCPAHLRCVAPPALGGSSMSSMGSMGSAGGAPQDLEAPEPDPNERRFCIFIPDPCTANEDCAAGFVCALDCNAETACAGEDCPDPPADPCAGASGECLPPELPCQEDGMCENDWICAELPGRCEPGIDADDDMASEAPPAGGEPAPREPAPDELDDDACEAERACLPASLADFYAAVENARGQPRNDDGESDGTPINAESGGGGGAAADGDGGDDDSGGCACDATAQSPAAGSLALLALLAMLPLGWRRRR